MSNGDYTMALPGFKSAIQEMAAFQGVKPDAWCDSLLAGAPMDAAKSTGLKSGPDSLDGVRWHQEQKLAQRSAFQLKV